MKLSSVLSTTGKYIIVITQKLIFRRIIYSSYRDRKSIHEKVQDVFFLRILRERRVSCLWEGRCLTFVLLILPTDVHCVKISEWCYLNLNKSLWRLERPFSSLPKVLSHFLLILFVSISIFLLLIFYYYIPTSSFINFIYLTELMFSFNKWPSIHRFRYVLILPGLKTLF